MFINNLVGVIVCNLIKAIERNCLWWHESREHVLSKTWEPHLGIRFVDLNDPTSAVRII